MLSMFVLIMEIESFSCDCECWLESSNEIVLFIQNRSKSLITTLQLEVVCVFN